MKRLLTNKSFRKILTSYLLILILPVMAGLLLCLFLAGALREKTAEVSTFSVERLQRDMDSLISEARFQTMNITGSEELRAVISARSGEDIENTVLRYNINSCAAMLVPDELFGRYTIYFHDNQTLLTYGNRILPDQLEEKCGEFWGLSSDALWKLTRNAGVNGNIILNLKDERCQFLFLKPILKKDRYDYGGVLVGEIPLSRITALLREGPLDGTSYLLCGEVWLGENGAGSFQGDANDALLSSLTGERVIGAIRPSQNKGLLYATATPVRSYNKPIRSVIVALSIYVFGCLVLGGIAALWYAQKRYSLIDRFVSLTSTSTPEDAVRSIEQTLRREADQRREAQHMEYDNAWEKLLADLLIDLGTPVSVDRLRLYDLTLDRSRFATAIFLTDHYENLFFGEERNLDEYELADLAYTIVRSVVEELCGAVAQSYVTRVHNTPTVLMSFDREEAAIDQALGECAEFIAANFGLRFNVIRGETVPQISALSHSLRDALQRSRASGTLPEEAATPDNLVSEAVRNYIDTHYSDPQISISSVAEATGFSASHISHTFKQSTGVTVLEYINGVRLTVAKELLRTTGDSAASIADRVGYSNFQTFNRTMRRLEGMTPSEYRKLHRGG